MSRRAHIYKPAHIGARASDAITGFVGSYWFIWLHLAWFTVWIVFRVEAFPFGLLTMIVSLEAILLSTIIMISQNQHAERDRKRDDLESFEVDQLVKNGEETKQLNEEIKRLALQQVEMLKEHKIILDQQTEILELLKSPPKSKRVS